MYSYYVKINYIWPIHGHSLFISVVSDILWITLLFVYPVNLKIIKALYKCLAANSLHLSNRLSLEAVEYTDCTVAEG